MHRAACAHALTAACPARVRAARSQLTKSAVTHKATKRALTQLSESLADELREAGVTSIGVHNLSPGESPAAAGAGRMAGSLMPVLTDELPFAKPLHP